MNLRAPLKPKRLTRRAAAKNLLRWNLKGQAMDVIPRRGIYIRQRTEDSTCYACMIGLVMLGRYGKKRATRPNIAISYDYAEVVSLVHEIQKYGPSMECPVDDLNLIWYCGEGRRWKLGALIEHLFENHRWSVMKIDKWLAELAGLDLKREQERVGLL